MNVLRVGNGIELTEDRLFRHRVRRLVAISTVALGVIWGLAFVDDASAWILVFRVFALVSMPTILAAPQHQPSLRYALIVPATAVSVGLVGMVMIASDQTVTGWFLITGGILLGGFLGVWFWFRWLPVPRILDDPFDWPRVALVSLHLALVLAGAAFVAVGLY